MLKRTAVAVIFLLFVVACVPYKTGKWSRDLLPYDNLSVCKTLHLSPDDRISVTPIKSGTLKVKRSGAINLDHENVRRLKEEEIIVPVYAYLISHKEFGFFLIDTGSSSAYIDNEYGEMEGWILSKVMVPGAVTTENTIDLRLKREIGDLNLLHAVFFTHLHLDHTSGLSALPDNLILLAGKGEMSISFPPFITPNHFEKDDIVYFFDFEGEDVIDSPLGKAIDIFGDQSLFAVSTPGHSKGHVSYLINCEPSPVLVAGDASILNDNIEFEVGPGNFSSDKERAQQSIEKIIKFKKAHPSLRIWSGHDRPESFETR